MTAPSSDERTAADKQKEIWRRLYNDRVLAHKVLFKHRHADEPPPFHQDMILDWHSGEQYLCELAFRGSAKSTIAEEAIIIMACFKEFENCIIFGASADLAAQRLHAIRREFEKNKALHQAFGYMRGQPWGDDKIELTNGVVISAMGRGQALRGTKEEVERPDLVFMDDIEDKVSVSTDKGRDKVHEWVFGEVIPAMAHPDVRKVRMAANAIHAECLAVKLDRPDSGFKVRVTPWEYIDDAGVRQASWPARYPLSFVDKERARLFGQGKSQLYQAEYMCDPVAPGSRAFKQEQFYIEPRVKSWQACFSMTDPARTTNTKSADTGRVVWSWVGPKLVIWDAVGHQWMPNEIIDDLFWVHETFNPAIMGFEEDGLNQWALQPIRQAQLDRRTTLPLRPMKAPNSKLDFIKGLQPFFQAREVEFAKPMPDLQAQLLGFPNGKIDVPNALAYALRMRPGAPMYDDFNGAHVTEAIRPATNVPAWLCLNATRTCVTGVLVQIHDGVLCIYADYLREGEPSAVVDDIISAAALDANQRVRLTAGPLHFDQYNNVGLRQAIQKLPMEVRCGVKPELARGYIRALLQRQRRSMPMLQVSSEARWTSNAFAGGYSRELLKQGILADYAEEGPYRVMMEGLESFVGLLELGRSTDEDDEDRFNAVTRDGRRYMSMLGNR